MSGNETDQEVTIEMTSDGKKMTMTTSPGTFAAEEECRRSNLLSLHSTMASGPTLLRTYDLLQVANASKFRVVYFKASGNTCANAAERKQNMKTDFSTVALGNIKDIRLICRQCGAALEMPLEKLVEREGGFDCAACGAPYPKGDPNMGYRPILRELAQLITALRTDKQEVEFVIPISDKLP
jgi:hypothetical protein